MAARAIWKGTLKIGRAGLPVKIYAAVEDRKAHFHVLQNRTKSRVKQQMVEEETGKEVVRENLRKGYEVAPGTFVIVDDSELNRLKPEESRDITPTRFVPQSEVSNEWYERPYYLGPDDDDAQYFALVESLQESDRIGVVRWTMRGRSYVGALTPREGYLMLIKLRYSDEILPARELSAPSGPALDAKELQMAKELVNALEGSFEPGQFRDEYRQRVLEFVEAKAKGQHPRLPQIKEKTMTTSLDDQLAKSLAALKRGREQKVA
jgi:DNA end-binding protein Ku